MLSWNEVFQGAKTLSDLLPMREPTTDCYIMVGRGGLALGSLLSRFHVMESLFYLPFSRYEKQVNGVRHFRTLHVGALSAAHNVFLLDDILDSGTTMREVVEGLSSIGHRYTFTCVTLLKRFPTIFEGGDHLCWREIKTNEWITFPWEVHDPIIQLEVPF